MDDFGDFFQAAPVTGQNPVKPIASSGMKQPIDLNSKILSSFDLSGSSQKATFKFQQPSKYMGKRPQGSHFNKQSASSADWKNINLEKEFMAPISHQPQSTFGQPMTKMLGSMQSSGNNPVLNPDLMGLAVGSSPSLINPSLNTPQMVHGYQQSMQNNPVGLTGDWQYHAQHSMAGTGNQQFNTFPNSHLTNPKQLNSGSIPFYDHQSNMVSKAHTAKSSSSVTFDGSTPQFNPQMPMNVSARQDMNSVKKTNRGHDMGRTQSTQMSHSGSSLPLWMTDPNQIPSLYKQVLKVTATNNSFADTSLLYPIFLSSELPKDILGHIWTVANQSTPGKLTFSEVYTALALIALAQKGEMDLSIRYVLKLQTAPIPYIQLPQSNSFSLGYSAVDAAPKYKSSDTSSKKSQPFGQIMDFDSTLKNAGSSHTEAFADFQSFTVSEPSTQKQIQFGSDGVDFDDMSSFHSPGTEQRSVVAPHYYPDRDMINSPKHLSKTDTFTHDPPKQLLGSIDFNKFKDQSSSKVLHSAAKKLNVSQRPVAPSLMNDDFDDFKSAESFTTTPVPLGASSNNVEGNTKLPFMQPNATTETNDPYTALRTVGLGSVAQPTVGVKLERPFLTDNSDKYAIFRDIESTNNTGHSGVGEFADFQSVQISTSQPPPLMNDSPKIIPLSDTSKKPISEDILSISSLELPSLSRTILNNSIGTTAVSESSNTFVSPHENNMDVALFPSVPIISGKVADKSEANAFLSCSKFGPNIPDDGLYDLDEPISPVYQRKRVTASVAKPKSPKHDRSVICTKISNLSDSDFADFSAGPPPIDDDIDHNDTEFGLQEGDSSLVDFDAFGHFEEAKMEVQKKKESAFKRTKEDATAFSEFVKSSVVDLKPAQSHESSSTTSKQDATQFTEEDSSVSEIKCYQNGNSDGTLSFSVNSNIEESSGDVTGWKLEPSHLDVQSNNSLQIGTSDWEEEGNEIKARMTGSSNPMEIFTDHWSRCLSTCKDIIVSTGDIFASLNSPSVCHEVVNSTRGREFISCTSEVYGVCRRIRRGMETVGLEDEDLASSLKEIEIAWNNLLGFCPYTPSVHKTPEHRISTNREKSSSVCSLCLLDTESTAVSGLEYCGRFYHASCANLWLNQIAPILPRLEAPAS